MIAAAPAVRALRKTPPTALFGLAVIAAYLLTAVLAPAIAPYGETEIVGGRHEPWSAEHVLGTDQLGRDMLTRLVFGARNTIGIAFLTTLIAFFVGTALGLLAALLGRWTDLLVSRVIDVVMAVPALIFALLLLTILGTSLVSLILVIAVLDAARVFRVARAVGMGVATADFVEAARLRGESLGWIIRDEILPNAAPPLVAEFGLRFCFVFLSISALSFLGLGIQPPLADWGSMVRENATLITFGDITPLLPATMIALLTVSVNFVVDWMLHKSSGLKE